MDRKLRSVAQRFSAESERARDPYARHYAAARRWVASARHSLECAASSESEKARAFWEERAIGDLAKARAHRASARTWRGRRHTVVSVKGRDASELARAFFAAARECARMIRALRIVREDHERDALLFAEIAHYRQAIRTARRGGAPVSRPGIKKAQPASAPGVAVSSLKAKTR